MNKIFIRILLGLVATFVALGLFSTLVLNLTNTVREEHYWYDVLSPFFVNLAKPSGVLYQRLSDKGVDEILPNGLTLTSYQRENLSGIEHRRLSSDQLVVNLTDDQISAKLSLPRLKSELPAKQSEDDADRMLVLKSERGGEQVYEFSAWLLRHHLLDITTKSKTDLSVLEAEIQRLADELGLLIQKLEASEFVEADFLLESLADKGWVKIESKDKILLFIKLPTAEIYKVQLPAVYSALSMPVILFLIICSIIAIALLANVFVQSFDRRIRSIETAASRISRGELDARVSSAGEEDAISRLGVSFNSMADHIQRLMYVQKEMIHAVSHELRTPVARIRFGVQMIEDCQTPESVQKQVKGIDGDIQELDELIDEILTYARLEQGGPILAFQQEDVASIVEQVITEQRSDRPDMKIFSEYKEGSEIWKESEIETRYIHRSIQNLVGNAKRYADSTVKVVCSFDAETCRIDVEDDGPGIPEDQWESVFTPFARLDDSRTRSSGGYGLGLSIVRRILYWHGGQAFLGRSDMGGAKFSLVWPRKQNA